jgi:hypothetical protein
LNNVHEHHWRERGKGCRFRRIRKLTRAPQWIRQIGLLYARGTFVSTVTHALVLFTYMANLTQPVLPVQCIPPLTVDGILPPFVGTTTPTSASMAPYACTLVEAARRFCTSRARVAIFLGLLEYRAALANLGFVQGIQWLSGSFLEDIERLETRDPRDVDIVTFCVPPANCRTPADAQAMVRANQQVFVPIHAKPRYHCDPYFVSFLSNPEAIVSATRYWFGLFSHRRGGLWKGLLQVPLAISQQDRDAEAFVNGLNFP